MSCGWVLTWLMAQLIEKSIRPPTSDHNPTNSPAAEGVIRDRARDTNLRNATVWVIRVWLQGNLERTVFTRLDFPHLTSEVCISIWLMSLKTEPLKKPSNTQVTLLAISYCDVTDEECPVQWLSCFTSGIEFESSEYLHCDYKSISNGERPI